MSHLGARLAAYVDGELPRATRELISAHLSLCPSCRAEVEAESRLKTGLTGLGAPDPSAGLMSSLLQLAGPGEPALPAPVRTLGSAPAPGGHPSGWAAFAPPRPASQLSPPTSSLRPPRRRQLVAGVVSVAAVTLGAAFVGGDLSEPAPVAPTGGDVFAARYANQNTSASLTEPTSILDRKVASGLPGTGFFQPIGNVTEASFAGPGLAGLLVGSTSSRTTISGFTDR